MIPGQILPADKDIPGNTGHSRFSLRVTNTSEYAIQIGSHFHFFEANPALDFDRNAARGCRPDIPAGTTIRFEPGQSRTVSLIPFGGKKHIYGFSAAVMGSL